MCWTVRQFDRTGPIDSIVTRQFRDIWVLGVSHGEKSRTRCYRFCRAAHLHEASIGATQGRCVALAAVCDAESRYLESRMNKMETKTTCCYFTPSIQISGRKMSAICPGFV